MIYKAGDEVIVTSEGVNRVGVVLDRRIINKSSIYDVLLENRSALVMLNTSTNKEIILTKYLPKDYVLVDKFNLQFLIRI